MRTALEILKTELGYDPSDEIDLDQIKRNEKYIIYAMQTYASQALDAAAKQARLIVSTGSGKNKKTIEEGISCYVEVNGVECKIDKKSILSLKNQLK